MVEYASNYMLLKIRLYGQTGVNGQIGVYGQTGVYG